MKEEQIKIPNHVAIILDGNGRWAKEKGKRRSEGHLAGFENLVKLSRYILNTGTHYLSVYAFSTENFNRSEEEVSFLMNLFESKFKKYAEECLKDNIKLVFSGLNNDKVRDSIKKIIIDCEKLTENCTKGTLNICFNYGSHAEIVEATKRIVNDIENKVITIDEINEEMMYHYMFQDLPPIDFMIRTSGEERISNFMLYQLSYAELYFPKCYFPDFDSKEYDKALLEYTKRDRRFGGIKDESNKN